MRSTHLLQFCTRYKRSHNGGEAEPSLPSLMKISFFGAAGEVTGSCYLVESARARVLVDFGQHQGGRESDEKNRIVPPIRAKELDAVVVTHAHIDHTGRLPLLAREGYRGVIFATPATYDLVKIMLKDAAHLQQMDAARTSMWNQRKGKPPVAPLFDLDDVERVLSLFQPVELEARKEVAPGITIRFFEAGHILGSASVEMLVEDGGADQGATKRVVFSGDIGPKSMPIMRDPVVPGEADGLAADLVILESTYGDRDHRPLAGTVAELEEIVREAVWEKEKILVPAFAVGRSQLLMHFMGEIEKSGRMPRFPVYLDSPMAVAATEAYRAHSKTLDAGARAQVREGKFLLEMPDVIATESAAQSRAINDVVGAAVVIAASGMCTGGRIMHHLKHNLWRKGVNVVIVGFQSQGSLGRRLVEGAKLVRVLGEPIAVRAKIHTLGGLSAHAGQSELLDWGVRAVCGGVGKSTPKRARVVLTHGEQKQRTILGGLLEAKLGTGESGVRIEKPMWGESIEL